METQPANLFWLLADAFCYPGPGQLPALESRLAALPPGSEKHALARFLEKIRALTPGQWEELHTRTLDLNPPGAPYVGFQIWGESYRRGEFLAKMNRELMQHGIDLEGELPDHLTPVLRYLAQASGPLPELVEALCPALQRMQAALRKVEPANPYLDLLEAASLSCKDLKKETT